MASEHATAQQPPGGLAWLPSDDPISSVESRC
jgi:hypothetical protein